MKWAFPVATPETNDHAMLALRGDLPASFALLAQLGYEGVELMVRDPGRLDAPAIARTARDAGLALVAVSTGQLRKEDGLTLSALEEGPRRRALERGSSVIEFAAAIGAPQVNVGMFRGMLPAVPREAEVARDAATEAIATLVDIAQRHGVTLAVEIQSRFAVNWLNTVTETLAWLQQFPAAKPRILFDVYHAMMEEASIAASLIRAFPNVSYVQMADSNRLVPGRGHLPLVDFLRVLEALEYSGYVGVEVRPEPTAARAAADAIRFLQATSTSV